MRNITPVLHNSRDMIGKIVYFVTHEEMDNISDLVDHHTGLLVPSLLSE